MKLSKRKLYEDAEHLADDLFLEHFESKDLTLVVCHYDIAKTLINSLIVHGYMLKDADFHEAEWDGYDREYYISLENDEIIVEKAFAYDNKQYLLACYETLYIHEDCNSAILKAIETDHVIEYAFLEDCDCDEDFYCDCDECEDFCLRKGEDFCLCKDGDLEGNMHGFSFSKIDDDSNISFSFYSTSELSLDDMMEILSRI